MRHPHIVQMRAVIETADWVYIVMELLEGGELQENIEIRKAYSEADAAEVMLRLGLTLGFLHCQGLSDQPIGQVSPHDADGTRRRHCPP